jgi:hypothetical protein
MLRLDGLARQEQAILQEHQDERHRPELRRQKLHAGRTVRPHTRGDQSPHQEDTERGHDQVVQVAEHWNDIREQVDRLTA